MRFCNDKLNLQRKLNIGQMQGMCFYSGKNALSILLIFVCCQFVPQQTEHAFFAQLRLRTFLEEETMYE